MTGMNTANKLTMFRVLLIPVFLGVLYIGFPGCEYVALAVFILASVTDFADGYIARKRNEVTDFGKFMDPIADKALVFSALLWFVQTGIVPAWAALIVLLREFMVQALRLIAADNGRVIAAALSGKIKTAVSMICVILLLLPFDRWVSVLCVAAIVLTTVISGIEYFVKNRDIINWNK